LQAYAGGGVPTKIGELLTEAGVYLVSTYGGTEFGPVSRVFRKHGEEKLWDYLQVSDLVTPRMVPEGDGSFEAQFLSTEMHQLAVENLPDVKGYATSDIWIPHPTKPRLWKIIGRKDDVIVHTSGEKTVPGPMEDILMSSPYIMSAIMFGREHDQTGVLIELKPAYAIDPTNEPDLIAVRNLLWPMVEEANKVAPAFSRIFKEMMLIVSPNKPLPRAGKATVMRKAALALYRDEIEGIYAKVVATANVDAVVPPVSWSTEDTTTWLKEQVEDIHSGQPFSVSEDLFEHGMDSLSATILRRRIVGAMQSKETQQAAQLVTQTTIYTHPTIQKLADFLVGIIADPEHFVSTAGRSDAIEAMIRKYSTGLSEPIALEKNGNLNSPVDGAVVLLTGSTGNLGAQLLESLLRDSRVKTVYTLDRPSTGSKSTVERQAQRFVDKGFDPRLLSSSRLISLEGEASHKNLGLETAIYEQLRDSLTTIIHNAWKLDFNLSLSAFEPHVQGTRNLIDLARSSRKASTLKLLFTSSIASTISWDKSKGPYPEEVVMDPRYAVGNGYGEGKYVSERILTQSGMQATSFRIGQISGGRPNGAWATTDWVPILVKSSIRLGVLPGAFGRVAWLPMHAVAQTILDIAWSANPSPQALNVVHPRPVPWNSVVSSINEALVEEGITEAKIPIVDFQDWFAKLEAHASNASEEVLKDIPAIKLLDFFRGTALMDQATREQGVQDVEAVGMTPLSTEKIQSISETMKNLPLLDQSDALMWVKYWKGVGFF
jgi:thioester reductase-like protein